MLLALNVQSAHNGQTLNGLILLEIYRLFIQYRHKSVPSVSALIHNIQGSSVTRFHGEGTLFFSNGSKCVGKWEKGIAVEVRIIFRSSADRSAGN